MQHAQNFHVIFDRSIEDKIGIAACSLASQMGNPTLLADPRGAGVRIGSHSVDRSLDGDDETQSHPVARFGQIELNRGFDVFPSCASTVDASQIVRF